MQKEPTHPSLSQAWLVVLTASLFFFYSFVQLNIFNPLSSELMKAFHLTAAELGQLSALYFYADVLFLFPAGLLLDRFSTKKLLLATMGLMTVGTFIFGLATTYWIAALGRCAIGVSAAFSFSSCMKAAARWFPPKQMAFVSGVIVTMAMVGGLVAQTPMAYLSHEFGWRHAILLDGSLGVLILFAMVFIFQDAPPHARKAAESDRNALKKMGTWHSIQAVLLNPYNWLCGLFTALMNLPVFILGAIWGIQYLTYAQGLPLLTASWITTTFFLGVILGSPFFGKLSDWLGRRVLPMLLGAITSTALLLLLTFPDTLNPLVLALIFFGIGFLTSAQVLSYPIVTELNSTACTAAAISIVSTMIMIIGGLSQPLFGWLIERSAGRSDVFLAQHFTIAMSLMPIGCMIALCIAFTIKETYCQPQQS